MPARPALLRVRRPPAWLLVLVLAAAHIALLWAMLSSPQVRQVLPAGAISPEHGLAFQFPVTVSAGRWRVVPTDNGGAPRISRLVLFEDGKPLGPAHSIHVAIREKGMGRYSHWNGALIFSTSDGSDPRTNGREYSVVSGTAINPILLGIAGGVLLALDAALLIGWRRKVRGFLLARTNRIVGWIGAGCIATAALIALGLLGPVQLANDGAPKDGALALAVGAHAILGIVLALGPWFAAAGLLRGFRLGREAPLAALLVVAFPVGLVLAALLCVVALLVPGGRAIASGIVLVCLFLLWRAPGTAAERKAFATLASLLPWALLFGCWMGLLWHGPTATLAGSPSGDLTFYATSVVNLAAHPYPLRNLGLESAPTRGYFNMLIPAIGAAVSTIPGFDPFLFLTAAAATAYVLLTTFMLHLVLGDVGRGASPNAARPSAILLLLLCIIAAARYPYWVIESVPVVHLPSLTMAVWWMSRNVPTSPRWMPPAIAAATIGSALSKVVAAPTLTLVPLGRAWPRLGALPAHMKFLGWTAVAAAAAYCCAMLIRFLPSMYASFQSAGPETLAHLYGWSAARWFVLRDIGTVVLAVGAIRLMGLADAAAIVFGCASFLAFAALFQANFVCATLLIGLAAVGAGDAFKRAQAVLFTGVLLTLPAALLTDPAGLSTAAMWLLCLGGATWISLGCILPAAGVRRATSDALRRAGSVAAALFLSISLVAVGHGRVIVDSGFNPGSPELTPEVRDIWLAVRERTPPDALIFTDQVDDSTSLVGGWNSYATIGTRQIFFSDYYTSFVLRNDREQLKQRLALNAAVLNGTLDPAQAPTRHRYGSFYAVVTKTRQAPADWERVYDNAGFVLYKLTR